MMNKVFIGGSRRITRLNTKAAQTMDNLVEKGLTVLIGDANGADKAVQDYLASKRYENVVVYCMQSRCRNNLGNWETKYIETSIKNNTFQYYSIKDIEMARESDCGFMIWDSKSKGTLNNIINLAKEQKPVYVYFSPTKAIYKICDRNDIAKLLERCDRTVLNRFEKDLKVSDWLLQPSLWG
jgi:hypothetical protein